MNRANVYHYNDMLYPIILRNDGVIQSKCNDIPKYSSIPIALTGRGIQLEEVEIPIIKKEYDDNDYDSLDELSAETLSETIRNCVYVEKKVVKAWTFYCDSVAWDAFSEDAFYNINLTGDGTKENPWRNVNYALYNLECLIKNSCGYIQLKIKGAVNYKIFAGSSSFIPSYTFKGYATIILSPWDSEYVDMVIKVTGEADGYRYSYPDYYYDRTKVYLSTCISMAYCVIYNKIRITIQHEHIEKRRDDTINGFSLYEKQIAYQCKVIFKSNTGIPFEYYSWDSINLFYSKKNSYIIECEAEVNTDKDFFCDIYAFDAYACYKCKENIIVSGDISVFPMTSNLLYDCESNIYINGSYKNIEVVHSIEGYLCYQVTVKMIAKINDGYDDFRFIAFHGYYTNNSYFIDCLADLYADLSTQDPSSWLTLIGFYTINSYKYINCNATIDGNATVIPNYAGKFNIDYHFCGFGMRADYSSEKPIVCYAPCYLMHINQEGSHNDCE